KYSQSGIDSPYAKEPGVTGTPEYSCRQNFHFAFTDGYWNSDNASVDPNNYDNANHTLPTNIASTYGNINYESNTTLTADETPPIYRDGNTDYLGDIALYYWATDLSGLNNDVPHYIIDKSTDIDGDGDVDNYDTFWNPKNDPAEWQHMVNFTVGLGIDGNLTYDGTTTSGTTYTSLLSGATTWPGGSDPTHVDDLWHAAINSRGQYFSASNPTQLVSAFKSVLDAIDARLGSSSAVATTSSQYQAGTNLFQAVYDPSDWSGDLVAKNIITQNQQWSAATQIANQISGTGRQIITFDRDNGTNGTGVAFQWADIGAAQQTALNNLDGILDTLGDERLAYLRGDDAEEQTNGGDFRNRTSPLGDIVHSDPLFVPPPGPPVFFYPDNLETVTYSSFISTYSGRPNMVLFGANDGMLHILNANNGRELLAYVPGKVYANLSKLPKPDYTNQYYVDQPVQVADVFYGGGWHTIAIGGLGKGGQGIYALDVTNPANFTEANAANIARWEFTDADDADLGYTYTKPQIMKMNNGKWMVAFGNGYNSIEADGNASSTGDAALFLLDVESGSKGVAGVGVFKKISTGVGSADDPLCTPSCAGAGRANRLTDVVALDKNRDFKADILYATDLFG
ncbi:MAG: hypothetical protein HKM94_11900, partial [Halobacteria archaeon]|nr:hypothetical protein [Halobacteria archaeon]